MFGFLDTKEVDALAGWIAGELQRTVSTAEALSPPKKTAERLRKLDLQVAQRVGALAGTLNIYKKARLGGRVKQALLDAGYPAEFAGRYSTELVALAAVAGRKTG